MCGIIAYAGSRPCRDILFAGLRRLEYRGYDSAGISVLANGRLEVLRSVGNLDALEAQLHSVDEQATLGIAHTRWATHGEPSVRNAHPHLDCTEQFAIVLNGIIENYLSLKERLGRLGHTFSSDTDAEVVAHLLEHYYDGSLSGALRRAYDELEGHFTICAMSIHEPSTIVAVRRETPLVIGLGAGETFAASSVVAFLAHTRNAVFPEDGEVVEISSAGVRVLDAEGSPILRAQRQIEWDEDVAERGGYETFMLKEIHEQPRALADTLAERTTVDGQVRLDELRLDAECLASIARVVVAACGTSYHAGLLGKYAIERWARIPVEVDVASELRYREPIIDESTLCLAITQSGETADTLAAMRMARKAGSRVLAITNVLGSQATREADMVLYTRAGLEIGVAATKTLTAQFLVVLLLAIHLGHLRGTIDSAEARQVVHELRLVPGQLAEYLAGDQPQLIEDLAYSLKDSPFFLYLGRNVGLPVCLEGALKLKEIAYIPTESYAAGEMKHGPIALLSAGSPVVVVATDGRTYDKLMSNVQEVKARGARVIAVASEGNKAIRDLVDDVLYVPQSHEFVSCLYSVVPLQLLAYYIARARGEKVDQPRNLAKTVTVE